MSKAEPEPSLKNFFIEINCEYNEWQALDFDVGELLDGRIKNTLKNLNLNTLNKRIEVSILLTCDEHIQQLNNDYRDKNKPTNILSFPNYHLTPDNYINALKAEEEIILGDIVFSYETIINESIEQEKALKDHLTHLAVHAVLHLLGYNHIEEDEAERMEELEVKILKDFKIKNPYE